MNKKMTIPLIEPTAENLVPYAKLIGKPKYQPTLARGDIDYYHHIADANDFTSYSVASYLITYPRPFVLEKIERHRQTEEAFIPLVGGSIMILGTPGALEPEKLKAVYLDGSCGLILYRDTWHFAPFAINKPATFMLLSGINSGPDIEVLDVGPLLISTP